MEPNKFEEDFREKLNQRKIEPSIKAWDRLDAMLSVAEEKKPEKKLQRKWLYIAASFIGFLLVGTIFFNQNKTMKQIPKTVIVEKETDKEIRKDSDVKPVLNNYSSIKIENSVAEKTSEETSNRKERINTEASEKNSNKNRKKKSNQVAESSIIIKNNPEKQLTNNQNAIAENSKKENVDQLLEAAENKVVAQNSVKKSKVKINASDLLNQVDGELELSFREKVITKVNKNFQEVKVALSNRNQEDKK